MSGSESFLSRWSRRKAESAERRVVSPAEPAPGAAGAKPDGTASATAAADFDPASLPSIESVAAGADIRPFLQSGVPAELTRTALRTAWAADPAIRDFIGIAENQWDFNNPTAMPGFGPLRAADHAATLAAQMLASASDRTGQIAEPCVSAPAAIPEADAIEGGELVDRHQQRMPAPSAKSTADEETAASAKGQGEGNTAAGHDGAFGESGAQRNHRSHGSALPK